MGRPRKQQGMVVAREAIVITVGARPPEYRDITVTNRRTGERVTITDTDNPPVDKGDDGVPYAFRPYQKVPASHPAVLTCPGAFIALDELDEQETDLVNV